ncbi:MAG: hypothetical protein KFB93_04475 [Simkaniaceae bacterium]|jgi:hypothetical protein|nr:MAG: hypothetical protein KFB93_04475 [Simkaniaceae bacterium]
MVVESSHEIGRVSVELKKTFERLMEKFPEDELVHKVASTALKAGRSALMEAAFGGSRSITDNLG